jgi:hypothetical protein
VTLVVARVVVTVDEVEAGERRAGEIAMRRVDAGVEHRDDDTARPVRAIPGCGQVHPLEPPLPGPVGVVRHRLERVDERVLAGAGDGGRGVEDGERLLLPRGRHLDDIEPDRVDPSADVDAGGVEDAVPAGPVDAAGELDEQQVAGVARDCRHGPDRARRCGCRHRSRRSRDRGRARRLRRVGRRGRGGPRRLRLRGRVGAAHDDVSVDDHADVVSLRGPCRSGEESREEEPDDERPDPDVAHADHVPNLATIDARSWQESLDRVTRRRLGEAVAQEKVLALGADGVEAQLDSPLGEQVDPVHEPELLQIRGAAGEER